jgi:prepilin-type processing-associated H-X9-DG protein
MHSSYWGNAKLLPEDGGKASAILAADRNLTPDTWPCYDAGVETRDQPTQFAWNGELHRFRGNILFADGHVDLLVNGPQLVATVGQSQFQRKAAGTHPNQHHPSAGPDRSNGGIVLPENQEANSPAPNQNASSSPLPTASVPVVGPVQFYNSPIGRIRIAGQPVGNTPMARATNALPETNLPGLTVGGIATADSSMSDFNVQLVQVLQELFKWIYLLLLLLLLLYATFRMWLWLREMHARRRA